MDARNVIEGQAKFDKAMNALINSVKDGGTRRRLLYRLARRALQLNRKRITAQRTPEGEPFAPRKPREGKSGRMFQKIKRAAWLKASSRGDGAQVSFAGFAGRVAAVHHFGLRDRITQKLNRRVKYEERPLLGINDADAEILEDDLYQHFAHVVK